MLEAGFIVLILAGLVLAIASSLLIVALGVGLWGLHMGLTQGLLAAAPREFRSTVFGLFNFASGIALLLASLIAGLLWDATRSFATFVAGAAFTAVGLTGSLVLAGRRRAS